MPYLTPSNATGTTQVCISFPDDENFLFAVLGALNDLTREENWEQGGTLTANEAATIMVDALDTITVV